MSDLCLEKDQNPKILKKSISKSSPKKSTLKTERLQEKQTTSTDSVKENEGKKEIDLNQISFEKCNEENFDKMVDLITEVFYNQEPVSKSCGVSFENLRRFVELIARAGQDLSSIAIYKQQDENGYIQTQVVSAIISCDQKDLLEVEQKIIKDNIPKIDTILNLFDKSTSLLKEMIGLDIENPEPGQIIHQVLMGTSIAFQKLGLGIAVSLHNAFVCQLKGFQHAIMELTSNSSLNICKASKIGKIIYSAKYRDLKDTAEFKNGLSNMEESLLEEQLSIYYIKATDFEFAKYEQFTKDLKFIF